MQPNNFKKIEEIATFLKKAGMNQAYIGVLLGTGLGKGFLERVKIEKSILYKDIPNFPLATVEFHSGKLHYGTIQKKKVIIMEGRFHLYEGYHPKEVILPIQVFKLLGIQFLLLSNAAGNLRSQWNKGELMLIEDHINLQPANPLSGPNLEKLGPRFPDMYAPYDPALIKQLSNIAADKGIVLHKGIYAAVLGPNLETRAEYRYLQHIGADAVGMSTVPEVIAANHASLPCCAISLLTDDCDPDRLQPISIQEIIAIAAAAERKLTELYAELIYRL